MKTVGTCPFEMGEGSGLLKLRTSGATGKRKQKCETEAIIDQIPSGVGLVSNSNVHADTEVPVYSGHIGNAFFLRGGSDPENRAFCDKRV